MCGEEMSLQHILLGCKAYKLQPLLEALVCALYEVSPALHFKTLHPDEWGWSPWYPLLALREIEENALPINKGRKALLRRLKETRQRREWIIGNYYWALWKWRMKEIHDANFKFVPLFCLEPLCDLLSTPVPAHALRKASDGSKDAEVTEPALDTAPVKLVGNLDMLPPPVSHLVRGGLDAWLSSRGKSILRAVKAPSLLGSTQSLMTRERILRALTDDAYA